MISALASTKTTKGGATPRETTTASTTPGQKAEIEVTKEPESSLKKPSSKTKKQGEKP
ncbi:MAG: hypothetical protein HC897_00185 [Thermoanaerobaculia bacterium]|nr:hypothetical protein [Thermoanaerobaculia bacterium]